MDGTTRLATMTISTATRHALRTAASSLAACKQPEPCQDRHGLDGALSHAGEDCAKSGRPSRAGETAMAGARPGMRPAPDPYHGTGTRRAQRSGHDT